ncbi:TauD/TfdA family dioxygenase [Pseudorhodoferax sp. Leaf267]|uniref:TauD/TfdA dioxygenase family protein n=1 Tax=Pseudorhodoferax sp. Leaf267 TaxID=1736316 RepID=UPI0006F78B4F|nr:TauD/TfdA family dioxygenase [Pseudorhodoferax sp. Leaf267]KQP21742.1 hypothetical protein ASF43_25915 [Pseudorhodoferax sp. Leaf267]
MFGIEVAAGTVGGPQVPGASAMAGLLARHGVVVLRSAYWTPAQLWQCALGLGTPLPAEPGLALDGFAGISIFGAPADHPPALDVAQIFHHDQADSAVPPAHILLQMVDVPSPAPAGVWFDTAAALASLPPALQARLRGLRAVHQHDRTQVLATSAALRAPTPRALRAQGQPHPLVQRHPASGRLHLFLPVRDDCPIDGLDDDQSRSLLQALWQHVLHHAPRFESRFRPGDVYVWDNRATVHDRGTWAAGRAREVLGISLAGLPPIYCEET